MAANGSPKECTSVSEALTAENGVNDSTEQNLSTPALREKLTVTDPSASTTESSSLLARQMMTTNILRCLAGSGILLCRIQKVILTLLALLLMKEFCFFREG